MKITDIKAHLFKPSLDNYWHSIQYTYYFALVQIETDAGITGEYILSTEVSRSGLAEFEEQLTQMKPFVIGRDAHDREGIMATLARRFTMHKHGLTISSIDICLWDIAGKAADLPVYKLLGGGRTKIPAYGSQTPMHDNVTIAETVEEALALREKGYTAYKLHPPYGTVEKDLEACRAVREAVGDTMVLMHDPIAAYDRHGALIVGRELEKLDYFWYEAPIPGDDITGYQLLRSKLDIPLAIEVMGNYYELIRSGAIDILKAMGDITGGITDMKKSADLCELARVKWEPHNYGSTLCQAAHLHISLATFNCDYFELPVPEGCYDIGMKDVIRPNAEGFVEAPTKPGLGYEVDRDEIDNITYKVV
ncbi:MAG: mandelate racemase/muconate lactonizing enzyme family protein [Phycisphaeraceae bacterium]